MLCGLLVLAFGAGAVAAGLHPWVGLAVGVLWAATTVAAAVLLIRAGHRGLCWARRAMWTGVAALGAPLRMAIGLSV